MCFFCSRWRPFQKDNSKRRQLTVTCPMPTDTCTTQPLYVRLREYGERDRKLQEPEDQNICYETLSCLLYMTGKLHS